MEKEKLHLIIESLVYYKYLEELTKKKTDDQNLQKDFA
jgi:hypothetical protein